MQCLKRMLVPSCGRTIRIAVLMSLLWIGVGSQDNPQVIPPSGGTEGTYSGNNVTSLDSNVGAQPQPLPNCTLVTVYPVRDTLEGLLLSGAKLVEIHLTLLRYPPDFLRYRLPNYFRPHHWVRSTGRQGRSLLVLEDNYDFMSLFFLSIGVQELNVTLTDSPLRCLKSLTSEETLAVFRRVLLNDFKPQEPGEEGGGSLSRDEHICNMRVRDNKGKAEFLYTCCHNGPDGDVICKDVGYDVWIEVLMAFIVITKVLVVLYSPSFLPGSVYRLRYVPMEYIYHIPDSAPVKRIRMAVTQFPGTYGNDEKVVRLSKVKGMEYFKTMVDTNMQLDKLYDVTFDRVRLSIKSRRLLGENTVPVGLLKMLYNNFVRCRIRRLNSLAKCCDTNILGSLNPGLPAMKWLHCCRGFAWLIFMLLLITPWILRTWVFFQFEDESVSEKVSLAEELGLEVNFQGSFTLYLSPVHGLFVFIYLIMVIDSLVYGVISKAMKEKFKMVLRKCLRDMRERPRLAVCAWSTRLLVLPFQMFGVVGLLLFVPYAVLLVPLMIPLGAFYLFPALNLSFRLIIHLVLFLCPDKLVDRWENFSDRFSKVREQLDLNKITAEETFERGRKLTRWEQALQIVVILMCLISFWSVTFLLMEVVSFFVEMGIYTLMGIIVNAGATLQYITVFAMVVLYGRAVFNDVHTTYLAYHKQIHAMLLEMKKEEISLIAKNDALDQENTALRVQGTQAPPSEHPDVRLIVKEGVPLWRASSMLMFLDKRDMPFTPERFFYDSIVLNYHGAPGTLYSSFVSAFWTLGRILLFLFFVFIVVMAFGDTYSVSSTNQLLATVAGGFIPFLFRFVFSSSSGSQSLHTDSVQFRTQLHQAINRYVQSFPIYDIIPIEFGEANPRDSLVLNSTRMAGQPPSANHGSPNLNESHVPSEESLDMEVSAVPPEDEAEGGLDMIIDVSTAASRSRGPLGMRETGSVSMLGADSFSKGGSGRSARIYRPSPSPVAADRTPLDV